MEAIAEIKELSFTYPDGTHALSGINLKVLPGEKLAILGANGAGKSTLLMHLNGVLDGDGSIFINGMELSKKNLGAVRAYVGMIFQNPDDQLFSPTVYEDVAYGPIHQGYNRELVHERVEEALHAVRLDGFAARNPYHLSGGEKKRIAIATVLSMRPGLLVLDEPSSGLDPRARRELIELLQELPQAMLIATHDLDLARRLATRTILMNDGRIIKDAPTGSVLENDSLLFENGMV
jgi:cobalt transport protein ATP-binding subunit